MTTCRKRHAPLHTFVPEDEGSVPLTPLLQTSAVDFYGTTSGGNGPRCFT